MKRLYLRFSRALASLPLVMTAAALISGCSNANGFFPPASTAGSVPNAAALAASAYRIVKPLATTTSAGIRGTQGLDAFPAGLDAFPAGLDAFPAGLDAFPAIGQASAQTSNPICSSAGKSTAGCHLLVRSNVPVQPSSTPLNLIAGMQPGWLEQIYNLPPLSATAGAGHTVALVVAYDDPAAEADLAVYRTAFGLPPCTTANGCFKKMAQDGSQNYPASNSGWAIEAATDIETVSAVCPACSIMLVEAKSSNIPDLAVAVDAAAAHGATVISNSYGVPEAADNIQYNSHYVHPGVAIVASAGDLGYGTNFPASSPNVIAVGGTTLYGVKGGISEAVWPMTSSGCSAFFPKPSWQHDTGCKNRMDNDLAIVADPATGMAVYDSILDGTSGGWTVVGGTSIGSPIVASFIASLTHPEYFTNASILYAYSKDMNTITAGSNGTCTIAYFCNATKGYSGPSGVGSPNGLKLSN